MSFQEAVAYLKFRGTAVIRECRLQAEGGQVIYVPDAEKHYRAAYTEDPSYEQAMYSLARVLNETHKRMAAQKNYDQAIYYYQLLTNIDPNADPTKVNFYQFLKQRAELDPEDLRGKLELAQFAEKTALEEEALETARRIDRSAASYWQPKVYIDDSPGRLERYF